MTPEERQALREKHSLDWSALASRMTLCAECCMDYPCDVIKELDEPEPVSETDPKCFHVVEGNVLSNPMVFVGGMEWLEFTYCPKCGDKL